MAREMNTNCSGKLIQAMNLAFYYVLIFSFHSHLYGDFKYNNFKSSSPKTRPEKVDFVRMAGLMDAIIVPFSAVGISDSVNIILDQEGIAA